MLRRWIATGALAALPLLPLHEPNPDDEPEVICDRFSVCWVCQDGTCLLPIPGLGKLLGGSVGV